MSEYQYYEFQAVDGPLTENDMRWLRSLSTRAQITPTSFVNVYNWGNFRGDPLKLMQRCFDAFVYVTNFGYRQFILRLPRSSIDVEHARPYCRSQSLSLLVRKNCILLDFECSDEPDAWDDWDDGSRWMGSLIPLRADLMDGDWRCLYLAWLRNIQCRGLDDDMTEPAVPPGLKDLSAPLAALVDFMQVDAELVEVAAQRSSPYTSMDPSSDDLKAWVQALRSSEKDDLLLGFAQGDEPNPQRALLRRFREATAHLRPREPSEARAADRTVAELTDAWNQRVRAKERRLAEQAARERAQRAKAEARARKKHLKDLASRKEAVWKEIGALIKKRNPKCYDRAVELLVDLRDAAAQTDWTDEFAERFQRLRDRHDKKPSLMRRLDQAGLG